MDLRSSRLRLRNTLLYFLFTVLCVNGLFAQKHLAPPHRSQGIPGPAPHSFLIAWAPFPNAVAYEYVLTDNEFCFIGCSGDTRNRIVSDTFAIEYDMQEDIDYFWITRVHLSNGDTTQWTLISSFRSLSQELKPFVRIAPNPVMDDIHLLFDWAAAPDARSAVLSLFNSDGKQQIPDQLISKKGIATRFESHTISTAGLSAGYYTATIRVREQGDAPERTRVLKLFIP